MKNTIRWLLLAPGLLGTYIALGFVVTLVFFVLPYQIPMGLGVPLEQIHPPYTLAMFVGKAIIGFGVVCLGVLIAPTHKHIVAIGIAILFTASEFGPQSFVVPVGGNADDFIPPIWERRGSALLTIAAVWLPCIYQWRRRKSNQDGTVEASVESKQGDKPEQNTKSKTETE